METVDELVRKIVREELLKIEKEKSKDLINPNEKDNPKEIIDTKKDDRKDGEIQKQI